MAPGPISLSLPFAVKCEMRIFYVMKEAEEAGFLVLRHRDRADKEVLMRCYVAVTEPED